MNCLQSGIILSCVFVLVVNGQQGQQFSNHALTSALLNALGGNLAIQGQGQVPGRTGQTGSQRRPGTDRSGFELGASVPVGDRAQQELQRAQETQRRQQEVVRRQQEEQQRLRERQQRQREEQLRQQQQAQQAAVPVPIKSPTKSPGASVPPVQPPNPEPDRIQGVPDMPPPPPNTGSQAGAAGAGAAGTPDIMQQLMAVIGGGGGRVGAGGMDTSGMGGLSSLLLGGDAGGFGGTAGVGQGGASGDPFGMGVGSLDMFGGGWLGGGTTGAPDLFGSMFPVQGAVDANPFGSSPGAGMDLGALFSALSGGAAGAGGAGVAGGAGGAGGAGNTGAGAAAQAGSGAPAGAAGMGAGQVMDPFSMGGTLGGAGAAGMAAGMLNPMGPNRPFVPGMTPGLVMDLMNGRPGPVPMDIAQEAAAMRAMGMTPDQISDTLGDKMQLRQSMPLGGALMSAALGAQAGAQFPGLGGLGRPF